MMEEKLFQQLSYNISIYVFIWIYAFLGIVEKHHSVQKLERLKQIMKVHKKRQIALEIVYF